MRKQEPRALSVPPSENILVNITLNLRIRYSDARIQNKLPVFDGGKVAGYSVKHLNNYGDTHRDPTR
jgi:hypothetical protein